MSESKIHQPRYDGWAVADKNVVCVQSVALTERGAKVNWLWSVPKRRVMDNWSDDRIEASFQYFVRRGDARLVKVRVTEVKEPERMVMRDDVHDGQTSAGVNWTVDMPWHVTYYYLATGMEGRPDMEDFGVHMAPSAEAAIEKAIDIRHPDVSEQDRSFIRGCLTARRT